MFKHDNSIPFAAIKIIWVHDSTILLVMWAQTEKYAKNNPNYPTPSYVLVYRYTGVFLSIFPKHFILSFDKRMHAETSDCLTDNG